MYESLSMCPDCGCAVDHQRDDVKYRTQTCVRRERTVSRVELVETMWGTFVVGGEG